MDLDDELLGLAEGTTTKRKSKSSSSKSKSSKRKRPAAHEDSASDMDMSSEDDDAPPARKAKRGGGDDEDEDDMLFPLEGKYKDDADRRYIQGLNEIDREALLAERQEKISEQQQRSELRQMVKNKERAEGGRGGESSDEDGDDDDGPLRTGRNRKATGLTNEKTASLAKLKEKRAAKGKKKEKQRYSDDEAGSSPRRRGSSADDNYTDESDVDRNDFAAAAAAVNKGPKKAAELVGPTQFKDLVVQRTKLAEFCAAPWFAEWVKGAWVRFLIGADDRNQPTYRLCEVLSVKDFPEETYRVEAANTTLQLELRFAKNIRFFRMENVSNSAFTDHEFGRLARELEFHKMHLPTTTGAAKIKANLDKHKDYIMTEADVAAVLAKKGARVNPAAGKARLIIQRDFARQTGDQTLLDEVNASLALLEGPAPAAGSNETEQERMRRVNERNRASNREEIKKAEGKAQDERRRMAAALARGDMDVKVDPSARVKTMVKLHYDRETPSRPSTPSGDASTNGTTAAAEPTAADVAVADNSRAKGSKFEERVAALADVDVDLDF